jgi:hypothetical protein
MRSTEKTEVYRNPYGAINTVIKFIDNATERIDGFVDHTRPLLLNDIETLRMTFSDARRRGVKIRWNALFKPVILASDPFNRRFCSKKDPETLSITEIVMLSGEYIFMKSPNVNLIGLTYSICIVLSCASV